MRKLVILSSVMLTACGVDVRVPTDYTVHYQIEVSDLIQYFQAECSQENPTYTPEQIQTCADAKIGQILTFLGAPKQ